MDQNDRILLRQALTQAFAEKFDGELAVCGETAECSEQHVTAMKAILLQGIRDEQTAERKSRKKWLVAFLVAAALLLSVITVGAYHNEIKAFFEKIYEDYVHLTFNEGEQVPENEGLRERYTLGYVPDGYTLQRAETEGLTNYYQWKNAEGDYLIFRQRVLQGSDAFFDGESGGTTIIQCGEYAVYCRVHGTSACTYVWNDGEYAYTLDASKKLPKETLALVIENIRKAS